MTHDDRVQALRRAGYTASQAAFLAVVMVHGGCFLRRQYVAVTERRDGGVATAFLRRLMRSGHAKRGTYARRSRVYRVDNRLLYEAIGEEGRASQRPAPLRAIVRRLMTLDVVLGQSGAGRILATEREKVDYFTEDRRLSPDVLPASWYASPGTGRPGVQRHFTDRSPILIAPGRGPVSFLYVHGPATSLAGFDTYLDAHAPLLTQLPRVDVVFCSIDIDGWGPPVKRLVERWKRTAERRWSVRLTTLRADLERHFRRRQSVETALALQCLQAERTAVERGNRHFAQPRFAGLYGWWSVAGDAVLDDFSARQPVVNVGHVGLRLWPIPHRYDLFGTAIARDLRWRSRHRTGRTRGSDSALPVAA